MLIDTLRQERKKALIIKDKQKNEVLQLVINRINSMAKEKEIKKKPPLTEEEALSAIISEVKQINETLRTTPSDRTDILEMNTYKLKILEVYLPKQMSEVEIRAEIEKALESLGLSGKATNADRGQIMKELMPTVKGKVDGKIVAKLVESYLNA